MADGSGAANKAALNALKKKVADQTADGAAVTPEDTSRSALHYGEDHGGEVSGDTHSSTPYERPVFGSHADPSTDSAGGQQAAAPSLSATSGTSAGAGEAGELGAASAPPSEGGAALRGPAQAAGSPAPDTAGIAADGGGATRHAAPAPRGQEAPASAGPANQAPEDVQMSDTTVAENATGAVVGHLDVIDPDAADTHTFTLSDDRFEVVDGAVKLKDGVSLDHEAEATIDLIVVATDSGGASVTQTFEIDVTDVNEGPAGVALSATAVAENATGAVVGHLDVIDPDAGDTHTFTVSDDRFEVVDGAVKLKDGVSLDHEAEATIDLMVVATDSGGASVTQTFEIDVTDVNEGPAGVALSGTAVAENATGAVVGHLDVIDPDAGDTHTFTVSDDRFEVVDGAVKLKDWVSLEDTGVDPVSLNVTATDAGGQSFTQSFDIQVIDVPDVAVSSGFQASYFDFDHRLTKLDDVDWNSGPVHQEVVSDINYTNSSRSFWEDGSRDTFAARITGNIEVTESGTFDFFVGADDGVALYINGVEVVDNDGLHGFRTRSGDIELEPGTHVVEVRYFENYGHAGLKVEWSGPGVDGRELLPAPDAESLQTVNGMPLTLQLDIEESGANTSHVLEGLPPGTVVTGADGSEEVGADGALDITDWETSVLSVTPPVDFVGEIPAQLTTVVQTDDGQVVSRSTDLRIEVDQASIDPPNVDVQTGFRASYFDVDHRLRELEDIDWTADPTYEEVVSDINYENGRESFWEGGSKDTFGARITGDIVVEEGGSYDFFLGGDDGAVLYINGEPVIDNDGLHGYRTRTGEIELEPGTHEVEVRYFENYGHAGLKLEWEGPDTEGRELVQADPEIDTDPNGTVDISIAADGADAVFISGLPADTILVSGDDTAVADGSDIDLTGWNLDLIEVMPPPDFAGEILAQVSVSGTSFNGEEFASVSDVSIQVGDGASYAGGRSSDDDMLMASADDTDADGRNGWDRGDAAHAEHDDDAMREDVEVQNSGDHTQDGSATYAHGDY